MSDLTAMTLAEARDAVQAKKISSKELTGAFVKAIEAGRPLNAYITEAGEQAMLMADVSDRRIAKSEGGALEGLPLAIKDLFCTKGVRTTAASKILGNFVPPYESTVTQNLWDAGAVMLGKTNLDEFAMGSSNETSAFGPVFNPWRASNSNANLVPGGSSGGSSAAVAAESVPCRYRHRHRRFDPPARRRYGARRPEADLWPLLAFRHRRLCLVAGSGRSHDQDGA